MFAELELLLQLDVVDDGVVEPFWIDLSFFREKSNRIEFLLISFFFSTLLLNKVSRLTISKLLEILEGTIFVNVLLNRPHLYFSITFCFPLFSLLLFVFTLSFSQLITFSGFSLSLFLLLLVFFF